MAELVNPQTGQIELVSDEHAGHALNTGQYTLPEQESYVILDGSGKRYNVPQKNLVNALNAGYKLETRKEARQARLQEEWGGVGGTAAAVGLGAARGFTLSLSDWLLSGTGAIDKETLQDIKEASPTASIAGEIGGSVASVALGGPGSVVAKLAARGGARAGARVVGQSVMKRALSKAVASGVEGAIEGVMMGGAQLSSEVALGNTELTAESAVAHVGLGALLGGATGVGIGALGAITRGAGKEAKRYAKERFGDGSVADMLKREAEKKAVKGMGGTQSTIARIERQSGLTEQVGRDLLDPQEALGGQAVISETGGTISQALDRIRAVKKHAGEQIGGSLKSLDDMVGTGSVSRENIAQRVEKELLEPIAKQEGYGNVRGIMKKFVKELRENEGSMTLVEANKSKSRIQKKIQKLFGKELDTPADDAWKGISRIYKEEVEDVAERIAKESGVEPNLAEKYMRAKSTFRSMAEAERQAVKGLERIGGNRTISLTDYLLGGLSGATIGGPGGIAVGMGGALANKMMRERGNLVAARLLDKASKLRFLQRARQETNERIASSVKRSLKPGALTKTERVKSAASTQMTGFEAEAARSEWFPALRAGVTKAGLTGIRGEKKTPREQEIQRRIENVSQLVSNPEQLADRIAMGLAPLDDAAPETSSGAAALAAKAAQYLHQQAPKSLVVDEFQPHLDKRGPSKVELSRFQRRYRAVMDPLSILDDMERGVVSREAVETVRAIYPQIHQQIVQTVQEQVAEMDEKVPHSTVVRMSMLLGVPLDRSLRPESIQLAQSMYGEAPQEGQGGGGLRLAGLNQMETSSRLKTRSQRLEE